MPQSRSIQGNAFSWPTATRTSSHGNMLVRLAGRNQIAAALGVVLRFHLLEHDAGELAVVVGEFLRHQEIEDRDVFVHGVFLFPRRRLHLLEAGAHDDLHVVAAEPARRAAAIHRGVAAAKHDDALADLVDMAERDARQPIDADVDVLGRFLAARNVEIAAARRAAADEDGVVILGKQRLQAVDALAADEFDAEIEDVIAFLVDHGLRQAEFRNLRCASCRRISDPGRTRRIRSRSARDRARPQARPDRRRPARCACRSSVSTGFGRRSADIVLEIGGDALQAADRHRLLLDAAAPAGRLARPVAGPSQNARKDIGFPVDHVGVAVAACGDQTDVFGNRRMRRAGPLTIHHFVEIVRDRNIGWFH